MYRTGAWCLNEEFRSETVYGKIVCLCGRLPFDEMCHHVQLITLLGNKFFICCILHDSFCRKNGTSWKFSQRAIFFIDGCPSKLLWRAIAPNTFP